MREVQPGRGEHDSTILLVPIREGLVIKEDVKEIERRAVEDTEMASPKYGGKETRRDYATYRFLKGFTVKKRGRRIEHEVSFLTVKLPVICRW